VSHNNVNESNEITKTKSLRRKDPIPKFRSISIAQNRGEDTQGTQLTPRTFISQKTAKINGNGDVVDFRNERSD
jgi:hypothetical protein